MKSPIRHAFECAAALAVIRRTPALERNVEEGEDANCVIIAWIGKFKATRP